jgi:fermentation-respiration switch protein FrsA (DUF1100 family)
MRSETVAFYSWGHKLRGLLKLPDSASGRLPVIVEGSGWASLHSHPNTEQYHRGFVAAGFAMLVFDYRGFGESEGEPGWIRPQDQIEDILCAVTYAESRDDLDPARIGIFGMGGTGGGNAIYAAAMDDRIKCVAAMTVVADGPRWLHEMRREYEWVAFLERVAANRRRRVLENVDEIVDPREELMVASPERRADRIRAPLDAKAGARFHFGSAEALWHYRPLDVVHRIAPRALLLTAIENDVVTPEWHAVALYERAGSPKKLIRQTGVKHYESYARNYDALSAQCVDWYNRYLVHSHLTARSQLTQEVVHI